MTCDFPKDGFEKQTYYRIQISNFVGNPWHDSILYVGFLHKDGGPGSYSGIMSPNEGYHWRDFEHLGKNVIIRNPIKLFTKRL